MTKAFRKRFVTRVVSIGNLPIGGDNPLRIQSMTTSDTKDIFATVDQIMRLADHGCEIVRMTVQGKKEALACEGIKNSLLQKGYTIPLVADIHFYPPAAMLAAEFVDKVRINPGNFLDRRAIFKTIVYSEKSYAEEIAKIEEGFSPLVQKCKKINKALRIGTNHGSLSDRIMSRYGDTPKGMVESALEFARVCRKEDFHNFVFSMKASNTLIMIEAYRLLVEEMEKLGWDYPLHLGVTEAGEGEDGRIKSSIGIGTLLLEGLGDTIRVSLTEDPWQEIDPCKRLAKFASQYKTRPIEKTHYPLPIRKKACYPCHPDGTVFLFIKEKELFQEDFFYDIGCKIEFGKVVKRQLTTEQFIADGIILDRFTSFNEKIHSLLKAKIPIFVPVKEKEATYLRPISLEGSLAEDPYGIFLQTSEEALLVKGLKPSFILFSPKENYITETKALSKILNAPLILGFSYYKEWEDLLIHASAEIGSLLCDKLADGICLSVNHSLQKTLSLSFAILQAGRLRNSKTEFISCPGCGRTLFDLQNVTKRIREKTSHLPGVKIAIMGCIVNGPGEMADADFGYVGSHPGTIDLYIGKTCVEKNIDFAVADEKLIDLIKAHGKWVEPQASLIHNLKK